MKKVLFSVLLSLLCIGSAFSQFDAQFSQSVLNPSTFNPAAVGDGSLIQVTLQHRMQWLGIDTVGRGGGKITNFGINSPLRIENSLHGFGIRVMNDEVGLFRNQMGYLQYAFKKKIGSGVFSVGADVGFVSIGFDGSKVITEGLGEYYDIQGDKAIPKTDVSGMSFDMNVGAYYSTSAYYGGISYTHLNNPNLSWNDETGISVRGSLYLTGGFTYALADPKFVLKPGALFKTDFRSLQFDLSSRLEYDNKYWGGLLYRYQDAVSILAGINIAGGLSVGYSYDLPTSKIIKASWGSHEILVSYSFGYVFQKSNTKYKSIRIL